MLIPLLGLVLLCLPVAFGQRNISVGYSEIASILQAHCTNCHSGPRAAAGLRVDTYRNVMAGAKSGKVVVPGQPDKSELLKRILGTSSPRMPKNGPPWLSASQSSLITTWIAAGATE